MKNDLLREMEALAGAPARESHADVEAQLHPGESIKRDDTDAPGYAKHDELAEEMTTAIEHDLVSLARGLKRLAERSKALSTVDSTHGMRVYEAVREVRQAFKAVREHTQEMRRHLDENTP